MHQLFVFCFCVPLSISKPNKHQPRADISKYKQITWLNWILRTSKYHRYHYEIDFTFFFLFYFWDSILSKRVKNKSWSISTIYYYTQVICFMKPLRNHRILWMILCSGCACIIPKLPSLQWLQKNKWLNCVFWTMWAKSGNSLFALLSIFNF